MRDAAGLGLGLDATIASSDGGMGTAADATTSGGGSDGSVGCGAVAPPGWSAVIFDPGLGPCPATFTEHVVLGAPSVAAGACSCACTVTAPGTCGRGSLALTGAPGHGVDTCTSAWFTANVTGPECIAVPASAQNGFDSIQASPLSATGQGGTCSSQATSDPAALSEPPQRYCDVPPASAQAVCAGNPPAGFSACITSPGKVPCPSSTPFVNAFTVEDSADLTCGTCSACSVATSCSNPTVDAFTNATCAAPAAFSFVANGTCAGGAGEQAFLSIQVRVASNAVCTAGSSIPSVQLTGERTICCR
ncbi:MAG: hypothetical protein JOZ69_25825 [Myxococcales bacterium]|nr:hypothetical protein [Myxococcales bacterium]